MRSQELLKIALLAGIALAGLQGQRLLAAIVVGNCQGGMHFTTIQAAVNAAPVGATIHVCPGTYPEQVEITTPLTLKGVQSGNADAAVITLPSGTPVQPAQVFVHDTSDVTITNITVDDSTPADTPCSLWGIIYQLASGTVKHVAVRKPEGCHMGIRVLGGTVSVLRNSVQGGILTDESTVIIKRNSLLGTGISLAARPIGLSARTAAVQPGSATISRNLVANADCGICVAQASEHPVTIESNTVVNSQSGIAVLTFANATVTANKVFGSNIGVLLDDAVNISVKNNIITNSQVAAVYLAHESGGNTVKLNTINQACAGVLDGSTGPNTVNLNTFFNVTKTQSTGNSCP